jgi:hypothetical protein
MESRLDGGTFSAEGGTAGLETRPSTWGPRRWVVLLFSVAAFLLLPWVAVLVVALPSAHRAAHWDIAWAGFDVALALLLASVAITAWRRSPWFEGAATAAATLLFVDAWFDVLTSSSGAELAWAVGEALLVEIPLAIVCLLLARDAEGRLRVPVVSRRAAAPPRLRLVLGERPHSSATGRDRRLSA